MLSGKLWLLNLFFGTCLTQNHYVNFEKKNGSCFLMFLFQNCACSLWMWRRATQYLHVKWDGVCCKLFAKVYTKLMKCMWIFFFTHSNSVLQNSKTKFNQRVSKTCVLRWLLKAFLYQICYWKYIYIRFIIYVETECHTLKFNIRTGYSLNLWLMWDVIIALSSRYAQMLWILKYLSWIYCAEMYGEICENSTSSVVWYFGNVCQKNILVPRRIAKKHSHKNTSW